MFGRSRAVLNKILKDINKIIRISDIVVQIILILLCSYNIYNSAVKSATIKLIIYCCLLVITIIWFIYTLRYYSNKIAKDDKKKKGNIVKIFRLSYRAVLVGFNLYDVFTTNMVGLPLLLALFSAISYVLQILITLISRAISNYVELLTIAFEEDVKPISNTIESLKHPVYGIAQSLTKDKQKEEVDERRQEKLDMINQLNEERLSKQKDKKEERKLFRKEVIKSLFKRKKAETSEE